MSKQKLIELLDKSKLTASEHEWLVSYIDVHSATELEQLLADRFDKELPDWTDTISFDQQQILQRIRKKITPIEAPVKIMSRFKWFNRVAAIVFLVLTGSAVYFLLSKKNPAKENITQVENKDGDIAPAGYKAMLTLDDGTKIILDSAATGELAKQGNTSLINRNGKLVYAPNSAIDSEKPIYNTVSTARGEIYPLVLSDGTKLWLNSGSSIRFPVVFGTKQRRVEITGEVYWEVAKNASSPFFVMIKKNGVVAGEVQVLGTHFNVNAYDNENNINTTLLEGSVKMTATTTRYSRLLNPGQQAGVSDKGEIVVNNNADIEEVMAWKNGVFYFNNASIHSVLKQLSRWYDVDIVIEKGLPNRVFEGEIQRSLQLSQVLKILEKNHVHFKVEGKILYVTQ